MIQGIVNTLTGALEASALTALIAVFVWGILSVLLSPCHLTSIPLVVGFISGRQGKSVGQAFGLSLFFALGILITIALIGAITASLGMIMGNIGPYGNYIVAALLILIGLHLLNVIPIPWQGLTVQSSRKGYLAALLFGLVFGIALGPCTFAFMAPMLIITFKIAAVNLAYAIIMLLVYGIGHCAVIVAAGTSAKAVQSYLDWSASSRSTMILKKICGMLVILGGVYLIWIA